jgi:hypothetical protein
VEDSPFSDHIHQKGSHALYAFTRFEGGEFLAFRFGMRNRMIGCYSPGSAMNVWDDRHWLFGNVLGHVRCPVGISAYYDTTKNLITVGPNFPGGAPGANQGGFPATTRLRMAGNQCSLVTLGMDLSNNTFSTRQDGPLPDPQPAGVAKPERVLEDPPGTFTTYAAFPADDGLSIRAHTGPVEIGTGMTHAQVQPQAVNVSNQPASAAPAVWLTDLVSEYSWITDICPDPTSLTGGPGGTAPWSIAQTLTRGDAANPDTGPFRNSPGGLP